MVYCSKSILLRGYLNDCKLQLIFLIAGKIRGQCNGYARQIYILKCR